mmetsp:Transcript_6655/g.8229  ORF Transcript_6655/g.8229 Transcript_6655/m.8229 type:complete len:216 (-) Transcript_6655:24-671(-)
MGLLPSDDISLCNLVTGYIRDNIRLIPKVLICIIINDLKRCDIWWNKMHGNGILINQYICQTNKSRNLDDLIWGSIYGTKIIKNGIYIWEIKINKISHHNGWNFCIGIIKNDINVLKHLRQSNIMTHSHNYNEIYGWSVGIYHYLLNHKKQDILYAKTCHKNDIIKVILNLNNNTLKFNINNIDYGNAYKNVIKTQNGYRLVVCIDGNQSELELL